MKATQCFCLGLIMVVLPRVLPIVYKEAVYEVTNLTEEEIHVDIRSEIPTTLKWISTDEVTFKVFLRLSALSHTLLQQTSIVIDSNASACTIFLSRTQVEEAAAATGTGNRNDHVIIVMWLMLMLLDWRCISVFLLLLTVNGVVLCMTGHTLTREYGENAHLEIYAPMRFRYKDTSIHLTTGEVRLVNTSLSDCHVGTHGCQSCCHGHGVCSELGCSCDDGFDSDFNCSQKTREDVFFSHVQDPRLLRSVMSSGDVITLNRISNTVEKTGKLRNPELQLLDIKSLVNKTKVYLTSDGFIKKMKTELNESRYSIQIKRSRDQLCKMTLTTEAAGVNNVYDINNCNGQMSMVLRQDLSGDNMYNARRNHDKIGKSTSRKMETTQVNGTLSDVGANYVDIPVSALRCASEVPIGYIVSFEMIPHGGSSTYTNSSRVQDTPIESVFLRSKSKSDGYRKHMYLQLPKYQAQNLENRKQKCEYVLESRTTLCKDERLNLYNDLCEKLCSLYNNSNSLPFIFVRLCRHLQNVVTHFCDDSWNDDQNIDNRDCDKLFPRSVDLFSSPNYSIRPIVTFADGKTITGHWIDVSSQSLVRLHKNGIVIKDDKPEVKIAKVTVIPTDPVAQDIYQVKLDYICATNQTVIRMNVIGSDLYRNHVTCTGINECNCCILHAAGASNAVVDHVTINITDSLTGVHTTSKMVVVF